MSLFARLKPRLLKLDCCALCDASGKAARVVHTVKPLRSGYRMAGVARTVRLDGDFLTVVQALKEAEADEVLMIDSGLRDGAPAWPATGGMFGELLAAEAQRKKLGGLVIDGNCRDSAMLRELEIPVFSRGVHPNAGTATTLGQTQVPITMGGVEIHPGDIVLGDDDGVVVGTAAQIDEWLPVAEEIQAREAAVFAAVRAGRPLLDKLLEVPEFAELPGRLR